MKTKISESDWNKIESEASGSRYFLENKRFDFIRDYINTSLKEIEQKIINNQIKDVKEELTISSSLKRIFFTSKKVQIDELSGAYKWIKEFLLNLDRKVKLIGELEKAEEKGKVTIIRSKEK